MVEKAVKCEIEDCESGSQSLNCSTHRLGQLVEILHKMKAFLRSFVG